MSMNPSRPRRWPSPPLAVQIVALLLGGIVVAQLVTLVLTLALPPSPPPQHSLADIAAGLRGQAIAAQGAKPLLRAADDQPPSLSSPGWFVPDQAHADLAALMQANPDDLRLLFYAPLPFAGPPTRQLSTAPPEIPQARDGLAAAVRAFVAPKAEAQSPSGPVLIGAPPAGMAGPGFPPRAGASSSSSSSSSSAPGFPGGQMQTGGGMVGGRPGMVISPGGRDSGPRPVWASRFPQAGQAGGAMPGGRMIGGGQRPGATGGSSSLPSGSLPSEGAMISRPSIVMPMPGLNRPALQAPGAGSALPGGAPIMGPAGPMRSTAGGLIGPRHGGTSLSFSTTISATLPSGEAVAEQAPAPVRTPVRETRSDTIAVPADLTAKPAPAAEPTVTRAPAIAAAAAAKAALPGADPGRRVAAPTSRGLFGLKAAPYIEGDFIAAYRTSPGHWVTLRTQPETFPNAWQRRVMLWFAISFAIVAPLGWIFARRLAAPLGDFARAAERLGREPTADVVAQEGPAEVGQAARAFNQMQSRLRRYVEDRTGMIGAISHDLRTPLARLRFRIERASPTLRREMARDLDQMEAMITSVLTFMRENAEAGERQRVDLRSIVECAVDDAEVVGAPVSLEPGAPAEVEVDVLSVQRVFANLIDNAVKYGDEAQVRLFAEQNEVVAEITDKGPGLADTDLDRVFLPFYRSAEARNSTRQGVGLGLSTSRSTIRAHGGDIRLRRGQTGLVAEVRLPMARKAS